MWTQKIGENAGKVWTALNGQGPMGLDQLKTATRLKDNNLCLALGWLAREGKIVAVQDKRKLTVLLAE